MENRSRALGIHPGQISIRSLVSALYYLAILRPIARDDLTIPKGLLSKKRKQKYRLLGQSLPIPERYLRLGDGGRHVIDSSWPREVVAVSGWRATYSRTVVWNVLSEPKFFLLGSGDIHDFDPEAMQKAMPAPSSKS